MVMSGQSVTVKGKKYQVEYGGLTLHKLGIEDIAEIKGLQDLMDLEYLNLTKNKIKEIKGLENLANLKELYLGENQIEEIKGLESLTDLRFLGLNNNRVREIKGLENLSKLEELNLLNNKIQEIKELEYLTNLHRLILSKNQIREIKGLDTLRNLREISLEVNQIEEIKGLDNLVYLEELSLWGNQIQEIKGLDTLVNLQRLYLLENQIAEIKGLDALSRLKELKLGLNKITEIKKLETLRNLDRLELGGNRIPEPESKLLNCSPQVFVEYCKRKKPTFIFMLMPFKDPFNQIFENYIRTPLEQSGDVVKKADDFFKPNHILNDILESISKADIIIADLTGKNANVFYELGRAHQQGKYAILICQDLQEVPFDLRQIRVIIYQDSQSSCNELTANLFKYINEYKKETLENLIKELLELDIL